MLSPVPAEDGQGAWSGRRARRRDADGTGMVKISRLSEAGAGMEARIDSVEGATGIGCLSTRLCMVRADTSTPPLWPWPRPSACLWVAVHRKPFHSRLAGTSGTPYRTTGFWSATRIRNRPNHAVDEVLGLPDPPRLYENPLLRPAQSTWRAKARPYRPRYAPHAPRIGTERVRRSAPWHTPNPNGAPPAMRCL